MSLRIAALVAFFSLSAPGVVLAQPLGLDSSPQTTGTITIQPNDTGGGQDETIAFGPTGADTLNSNSAAGGNANRPERAVPNGSANGGGGSASGG